MATKPPTSSLSPFLMLTFNTYELSKITVLAAAPSHGLLSHDRGLLESCIQQTWAVEVGRPTRFWHEE